MWTIIADNINTHHRTNSVKINNQIFQLIQKNLSWPIFPNFLGKKLSRKSDYLTQNFIWLFSTVTKFRKNYRFNSKKTPRHVVELTKGQTRRRKYRQNLFYRTLSATARGLRRFWNEHIQSSQHHLVNITINTPAH